MNLSSLSYFCFQNNKWLLIKKALESLEDEAAKLLEALGKKKFWIYK